MTDGPTAIAQDLHRDQAGDVVVLLEAMGIVAEREQDFDGSWKVYVAATDAEQASRLVQEEYPDGFATDPAEAARAHVPPPAVPLPDLWLGRGTWAVAAVAIGCIAWFVRMHTGVGELTRARLLDFGATTCDQFWVGEWWRLASAVFVHFDGAHLLTNMLTLLIVGPPLAVLLGPWRFLLIFLLTGIAGNVFSQVFAPSASLKAGASGAIAGVIGALGGTSLDPGWHGRFKRWQVLGAVAAVYGLVVGAAADSDNAAHLGGLLAGIVLGRLLTPATDGSVRPAPRRPG